MTARIVHGDCLDVLRQFPDASAQTCVTSPPYYGLRDYGVDGQIGQEETPEEFIGRLVEVFREVRRVLTDDGTLWVNIGDSYATTAKTGEAAPNGSTIKQGAKLESLRATCRPSRITGGLKQKDLIGIPWMLAFALRADGWYLRQDIIWHKPNPMPESVTDRCTKAHEYVFLLSKGPRYFINPEGLREPAVGGQHPVGRAGKSGDHVLPGQSAAQHRPRPQYERARELAEQAGLTPAHLAAIRAVGLSDAGKAQVTQTGAGANDAAVQALADEAKAALGGYYREFLSGDTRNRRSVWSIPTTPFPEAHFATMPLELARMCIVTGSRPGDTVLDPFMGAFTTAYAALELSRNALGAELNAEYIAIGERRIAPLVRQPALLGAM